MPDSSTRLTASRVISSISRSFCASSWVKYFNASGIFMIRFFLLPGIMPPNISRRLFSMSSMPPIFEIMPTGSPRSFTSISTVRLSRVPSLNCLRSFCRVESAGSTDSLPFDSSPSSWKPVARGLLEGNNRSNTRSSAISSALRSTRSSEELLTMFTDCSVRSRMMDSTSRPT